MQLREIYIDGFGIFRDRQAKGLSSGINVIHGPNEFGKSTLLDFIRRILFGFPSRVSSSINPYPALSGGAYGGRLVCQLASGKFMTIARKEGPHRGPVTIILDSKELSGQDELNKSLGSIGERFYQNVYAIGLDELEHLESLEADEVRSHIYGAGLGLGSISLKSIKANFLNQAEAVFKQSGSVQAIPKLYKEIRALENDISDIKKGLSQYDELVKQHDELTEKVSTLDEQISGLEKERRLLENQDNLFPTHVDLKTAEEKLAELEELPLFTEGALSELETLKRKITNLDERIEEETGELTDLEFQRDQLVYDEQIIVKEPDILTLLKKSDDFRKASTDIKQIETDRDEHDKLVKEGIERVGHGWTKENVRDFNLSVLQKDKIRTTKANLDEAERKLREQSKGLTAPALLKYLIYFVTALGLICAVSGFVAAQTLVAMLSTTIFVVGVGLILFMLLSKRPEQEYRKLSEAKNSLQVEWREFLGSINFDGDLSPDGVQDLVNEINGIKSQLELLATAEDRIKSMQATINEVENLHNQVAAYLDKSKITDNILANIDIFNRLLDEAKDTKRKKEILIKQIGQQKAKIEGIKNKRRLAEEELQSYISSLGTKDEADFRHKYDIFLERENLKGTINESRKVIQSTVGMGDHYNSFIESISATKPDEIKSALEKTASKLKELKEELKEKNQAVGELRTRISQLSSSTDFLVKQNEVEMKKQHLRDNAADWVRAQVSLFVLEKAISEYENTRQPEVIKAAKDIFANITNHEYSMIIKAVESNELKIQDSSGRNKSIIEMSRGTKEQLYFAMRLGLIKVYEAEKEPMPIIMDDILVNFDDDRGPLAIKELAKFARDRRDRQVVVLTCHKNALDLYISLGAKKITFD
jgi:uncharacterized protein YhaN